MSLMDNDNTDSLPGMEDDLPVRDTDGDTIPDSQDPDLDGDGIDNSQDGDVDGDGIDNEDDDDIDGDSIPNGEDDDVDGDGVPNDLDSDDDADGIDDVDDSDDDNDGVNDSDESPEGTESGESEDSDDASNSIDSSDADGDGIDDSEDNDDDNDGIPDSDDPDDDNDGVLDEDEDDDNDGIRNGSDEDDDGNGIRDSDEVRRPIDPCLGFDADGCNGRQIDASSIDGDDLSRCAWAESETRCVQLVRRDAVGSFDEGYKAAVVESTAQAEHLNAIIGVLGAFVGILLLAVIAGGWYLWKKNKGQRVASDEQHAAEILDNEHQTLEPEEAA